MIVLCTGGPTLKHDLSVTVFAGRGGTTAGALLTVMSTSLTTRMPPLDASGRYVRVTCNCMAACTCIMMQLLLLAAE